MDSQTKRTESDRQEICEERLKAFFRAAMDTVYPPECIREICRGLNEGRSLSSMLIGYAQENKLDLLVKQLVEDQYEIDFGFRGSALDDGGVWKIEFDKDDRVVILEQPGFRLGSTYSSGDLIQDLAGLHISHVSAMGSPGRSGGEPPARSPFEGLVTDPSS